MCRTLVSVILLASVWLNSSGQAHAMNGREWYETCIEWMYTGKADLKPEKRVAYRACQIEAVRVYCNLNYQGDADGAGKSASDEIKRQWAKQLSDFCPNINPLTFPFGGPPVFALRQLEKEGGPGLVESYLPASWVIQRGYEQVFHGCAKEREKLGLRNDPRTCFDEWMLTIEP